MARLVLASGGKSELSMPRLDCIRGTTSQKWSIFISIFALVWDKEIASIPLLPYICLALFRYFVFSILNLINVASIDSNVNGKLTITHNNNNNEETRSEFPAA